MEIIWIKLEFVLAVHKRQIAEHGGSGGLRDEGLLISALHRPENLHQYGTEVDLPELAARYAFGIAKNHPFVDGNKRTAMVVAITFLRLNGFSIEAPLAEVYTTFLGVADGRVSEEGLSKWLREHLVEFKPRS